MIYEEYVKTVKDRMQSANTKAFQEADHLAYQINVTGEGEGAFYIELKQGKVFVEPYEYYDRDVIFTVNQSDFLNVIDGAECVSDAIHYGRLHVQGSYEKALKFEELKPVLKDPVQEVRKEGDTPMDKRDPARKNGSKKPYTKRSSKRKSSVR